MWAECLFLPAKLIICKIGLDERKCRVWVTAEGMGKRPMGQVTATGLLNGCLKISKNSERISKHSERDSSLWIGLKCRDPRQLAYPTWTYMLDKLSPLNQVQLYRKKHQLYSHFILLQLHGPTTSLFLATFNIVCWRLKSDLLQGYSSTLDYVQLFLSLCFLASVVFLLYCSSFVFLLHVLPLLFNYVTNIAMLH